MHIYKYASIADIFIPIYLAKCSSIDYIFDEFETSIDYKVICIFVSKSRSCVLKLDRSQRTSKREERQRNIER